MIQSNLIYHDLYGTFHDEKCDYAPLYTAPGLVAVDITFYALSRYFLGLEAKSL